MNPTERAREAIGKLKVLPDDPARRAKLTNKVELLLWKFVRMRWHDIHRFFESVEPIEALELSREKFEPGKVFDFLSLRQDDAEWENSMTVGLSLLFAAMNQAKKRGFDPRTAGIFTLQRMMEQAVDEVGDLEDLLTIGAPS